MRALLLSLLLAGCTQVSIQEDILPVPPIPPAAPAAAPAAVPMMALAQQRLVVEHFDAARVRELDVVLAPGVSVDQIQRIHQRDRDARAALRALGHEHNHPSAAAMQEARSAVHALEEALNSN